MKSAAESPQPGQIIETTTRKRVVPLETEEKPRTTPEFWTYLENLKPQEWERHIFYIYRDEPSPTIQVAKHTWESAAAAGIPWNDREEAEARFLELYGGKQFRVIVKRGHERVTYGRIYVNAPAKPLYPTSNADGPQVFPVSEASATAQVANKAIDTMAGQEHQAVNLGLAMMQTAAGVVKNFSESKPAAAPAPSQTETLMQMMFLKMMEKMMDRMDQPPPQAPAPVASTDNPLVNRILETGLERVLNPGPSAPAVSTGAELVRTLPQVASYVAESIREWRVGSEAQRDTALVMRGVQPPAARAPNAPGQPALPAPSAVPNQIQPRPGEMVTPDIQFVESKIVEILREPLSADEAADEAIAFLDRMDPSLIKTLSSLGEPGLANLFNIRPVLHVATENMPRLLEFIKSFLKYAQENEAKAAASDAPPPKPN